MGLFKGLFGGGGGTTVTPPPPPAPPPAPPTVADSTSAQAGNLSRIAAAGAAGAGFDQTLLTGGQGAGPANTTQKALTGQ